MGTEQFRVSLLFQRQLVLGIAYVYKTLHIGILCFNININCQKQQMYFFKFVNNWGN